MSEQITEWLDWVQQRADAATKGPWGFQYWSEYPLPSGDYAESILYSDHACDGELVRGLENEDGEFIAAARTDLPDAMSALRAVMGLHVPVPPLSNPNPTPVCRNCDWDYPCPTVKAIGDALGVEVTE